MNYRDRVDRKKILFTFNVSNSSWHIIMKLRRSQHRDKNETKGKQKIKETKNRNSTRPRT